MASAGGIDGTPHPPARPRGDAPGSVRPHRRPPLLSNSAALAAVVVGPIGDAPFASTQLRESSKLPASHTLSHADVRPQSSARARAPLELERAPSRLDSGGDEPAVLNPYSTLPSIGTRVPDARSAVSHGKRPAVATVNVFDGASIPSAQRVAQEPPAVVPRPPPDRRPDAPSGAKVRRAVAVRTASSHSTSQTAPVPDEPPADAEDAVSIAVRLQDGRRLQRRFWRTDTIGDVARYVQQCGVPRLTLIGNGAPAVRYSVLSQTLEEAGMQKRALLLAEEPKRR